MSDQHRKPMELGEVIDYQDFRTASRELIQQRQRAVEHYEQQCAIAAKAEADYQEVKATRLVTIKAEQQISGTEAVARIKGDDLVRAALIDRDREVEILKAKRERIEGIDEASAHLRKLADWSMRVTDPSYGRESKPLGAVA